MELWNRGSSACTLTWSFVCSQNLTQHASRITHGSTETKGHRSDVRARKPNEQGLKTWVTLIEAHWQQVNISLQEYSVTRGACSSHWEKKRHRRSLNWSRNDSSFAGTLRKWAWRSKEKKKKTLCKPRHFSWAQKHSHTKWSPPWNFAMLWHTLLGWRQHYKCSDVAMIGHLTTRKRQSLQMAAKCEIVPLSEHCSFCHWLVLQYQQLSFTSKCVIVRQTKKLSRNQTG